MTIFIIVWLACGVVAYGLIYAHFQGKFPHIARIHLWYDFRTAIVTVPFGISALAAAFYFVAKNGYYGFKFLPRHER